MNKVILFGRLTRDPELRSTATGKSTCSFSLAVRRGYKNANGEYVTDFINCTAWNNTAEFVSKYFKKGQQMVAYGLIQTRKWDDNGTTRYATDVLVDEVEFAGKNDKNSDSKEASVPNDIGDLPMPDMGSVNDDDLPF